MTDHDFGTGTVVRRKEDECVLINTHRLELLKDTANLTVHPVDHGRMNGHLRRLEPALLVSQLSPRKRAIDLARPKPLDGFGKIVRRTNGRLEL